MNPVVVVHGGGASNISKDRKERVRQGIIRAATVGYNILQEGGSAVDAVEGAVTVLEDDPEFNAGCGSVLNVNGEVEMDASIMNGKDLSSGAVSAVRCIANPIKLARLVMEKTPHCFLTDQGAAKFAADMGVPEVPEKQLITERNIKHLEKEKNEKSAQKTDQQKDLGTVGAVALDSEGNVAYATSTGGIVNKMAGRVGDTPCVGSGGYADNHIGAISTTGHGESILKVNLARLALFHIEQGKTVAEAADLSLGYMKSKLKGLGGVILINTAGDWAVKWTSTSMPWAAAKDGKLHSGIDLDDTSITDLP
ncbi:isoaspartyl peptidase/L-asparaginase [Rousettus aegyptiacus]|nr:isoaspartyl peptidase/L-asparaginase [Rousettus aegyptiacus]XP_015983403.1 isoaspartyl peptidase/L-asparaginase [Rousettus aegyptiacus]XP_015983404.1 isoaspartyl peptidase/L-asparaginase [Rousettus aegyptiacus]XP_015983405.1 isoaspartyl peptidase/L-asparaginase [Rousettus aegyptiacus]XP_015983406.1 isoaspartyl peptidase/L-asparaginase [Rousettus aegyptiacus]KAF6464009.1 asparaginase and isoaspartyl peptidase 1 [Rousettus aegyptiacus]